MLQTLETDPNPAAAAKIIAKGATTENGMTPRAAQAWQDAVSEARETARTKTVAPRRQGEIDRRIKERG